jgi:hypothetical protein
LSRARGAGAGSRTTGGTSGCSLSCPTLCSMDS